MFLHYRLNALILEYLIKIRMVDDEILSILRQRYEDCGWYYGEDKDKFCTDYYNAYIDASGAWFAKCI